MYIVFGNQVEDSKEIKALIEEKSDFKVVKDMSKGSKREDILAYNLSIKIDRIHEIIEGNQELRGLLEGELSEDDLFDQYLNLAEEIAAGLEEILPREAILEIIAYKWDKSDDDIKLVVAIAHEELGKVKLKDVMRTLIKQVE